jgi:hypothetical protein
MEKHALVWACFSLWAAVLIDQRGYRMIHSPSDDWREALRIGAQVRCREIFHPACWNPIEAGGNQIAQARMISSRISSFFANA